MAGRTATAVAKVSRLILTAFPQPTLAGDAGNGNSSPNDGATFLAVYNADAANTYSLSVQLADGVDQLTPGTRVWTVPVSASGTQIVGPFPVQFYGAQLLWNVSSTQLKVALYSLLGP